MPLVIRSYKFSEVAQGKPFKLADGRVLVKLYEPTPEGETAQMLKGSTEGRLYAIAADEAVEPLVLEG